MNNNLLFLIATISATCPIYERQWDITRDANLIALWRFQPLLTDEVVNNYELVDVSNGFAKQELAVSDGTRTQLIVYSPDGSDAIQPALVVKNNDCFINQTHQVDQLSFGFWIYVETQHNQEVLIFSTLNSAGEAQQTIRLTQDRRIHFSQNSRSTIWLSNTQFIGETWNIVVLQVNSNGHKVFINGERDVGNGPSFTELFTIENVFDTFSGVSFPPSGTNAYFNDVFFSTSAPKKLSRKIFDNSI